MPYYQDLREHIKALEANNKLVRVKRQINKDTELMPLVRWQFRGLPEEERKAFLFENVVDVKGKKYEFSVLVASHAASREVYAIGMKCKPEEIMDKWTQAQLHPVKPQMVSTGPVQEVVHMGDSLLEHGGLAEIPVPISTPGLDNAPYFTAGNWVTKDPETGIGNMGVYRAMIKSPTRCGAYSLQPQQMGVHWIKCRERGILLQAAIVLGASPNIGYTGVTPLPYGIDEYDIAGGIAGEPVKLVKCKTVDIEVPATAEIVVEGIIPTDSREREAPFGEYTGYMGAEKMGPYLNVTCITHRKDAIYHAFISQFPPSESSKLRQVGSEAVFYKFLKYDCNIPNVLDIAFHESSGAYKFCVIRMRKTHGAQPWQALHGAVGIISQSCKIVVVVDDDIDARDLDSVVWAMSFRMLPHRDVEFVQGRTMGLDPSFYPMAEGGEEKRYMAGDGSALLVDATRKWPYPPVSLPKKEFMENARKIWQELGLPKLIPRVPWHGYTLGYWTKENEEEAELALKGEHYQTGEKLATRRTK